MACELDELDAELEVSGGSAALAGLARLGACGLGRSRLPSLYSGAAFRLMPRVSTSGGGGGGAGGAGYGGWGIRGVA
jgi:hypothetical protein